jgi:hypothetical protein
LAHISRHAYAAYSVLMPATPTRPPAPLMLAAALLGLEAVAAIVYGTITVTQVEFSRAVVGSGVAILMLGYGILLVLMARGVFLGRRWSRGPAAATQLILLPIAWSFRASPTTAVGLVIAGVAVGTLIGLLHPRSTEVFVGPASPPDNAA